MVTRSSPRAVLRPLLDAQAEGREAQLGIAHEIEELVRRVGRRSRRAPATSGRRRPSPGRAGQRRDPRGCVSVIGRIVAAGPSKRGPPRRDPARGRGQPPAGPATETGFGHRRGIQQPVQVGGSHPALERELTDRPARSESLLCELRGFVVADDRGEGGREHEPLLDELRPAVGGGQPFDAAGAEVVRGGPEQRDQFEQRVGRHRQHDVELEEAPGLRERDGRIVPDDPCHDHRHALDDDRVHLARHDAGPRLGLG